jgi:16S rRNA (uracil1498-N3)-methyltransferase
VQQLEFVRPRTVRLVLVQALAKAKREEGAVAAAVQLGVDAIIPWFAGRSVVAGGSGRAAHPMVAGPRLHGVDVPGIANARGARGAANAAAVQGSAGMAGARYVAGVGKFADCFEQGSFEPAGNRADGDQRLRERWQRLAKAESMVARRAYLPLVEAPLDSAGLTARLATEISDGPAIGVVLYEEAEVPLGSVLSPLHGRGVDVTDPADPKRLTVYLLVGPEGSLSEMELAAFAQAGLVAARLGPEVLRTGVAGAAALAAASVLLGFWD